MKNENSQSSFRVFWVKNWQWIIATVIALVGALAAVVSTLKPIESRRYEYRGPTYVFDGKTVINHVTINAYSDRLDLKPLEALFRGEYIQQDRNQLILETRKVLNSPRGLKQISDKVIEYYVDGRFELACEWALVGYDMINPVIKPFMNKSCSIEVAFAESISHVYLTLAEEAWSRRDFLRAKDLARIAVGVWGDRASGDIYAFAAAIEISERGGTGSIICKEAVDRFNKRDIDWLYDYFNRLARWGYLHPVVQDSHTRVAYCFSFEEWFGLKKKLKYRGPYIKTTFPMKDGRCLSNGELIVTCYQGGGKFAGASIPDPENRTLPKDFTGTLAMPSAKLIGDSPRPVPEELRVK